MSDLTPNLARLLEAQVKPTLGEIWNASEGDLARFKSSHPAKRDACGYQMWTEYDRRFANKNKRPDYRLWRLLFRPLYFADGIPPKWAQPFALAQQALDGDNVIVWGALGMLAGELTRKYKVRFTASETDELNRQIENVLSSSLAPIAGGESGCTAIKIAARCMIQQLDYESNQLVYRNEHNVSEHIKKLSALLKDLDPYWGPGKTLSLDKLRDEGLRDDKRWVIPYHFMEFALRVNIFFYNARHALKHAASVVLDYDRTAAQPLLEQAFWWALSAWRAARAQRISLDTNERLTEYFDKNKSVYEEFNGLKNAAQAARDAGFQDYKVKLGHLVLWTIPAQLEEQAEEGDAFHDIGTKLAGTIRQAGCTVPERFLPKPRRAAQQAGLSDQPKSARTPKPDKRKQDDYRTIDPYRRLMEIDRCEDPKWATLQTYLDRPELQGDPLEETVRRLKADKYRDELHNVFSAAFDLCMRDGRVRHAMRLIEADYVVSEDQLKKLVHAVKGIEKQVWYGLELDMHTRWRKTLQTAWLGNKQMQLSKHEALVMHEMFTGRLSPMMVASSDKGAELLLKQMRSAIGDDETADTMLTHREITRRGPGVIEFARLAEVRGELDESVLGAPVFVSVVSFGDEKSREWRLLATDGLDCRRCELRPINEADLQHSRKLLEHCFSLYLKDKEPGQECEIRWRQPLQELANNIVTAAKAIDKDVRWIVLATDENLGGLPWQNLLGPAGKEIVVSLVPNLGWTGLLCGCHNREYAPFELRLSEDSSLVSLHEKFWADRSMLRLWFPSGAYILAHGSVGSDGMPHVVLNDESLRSEDWIELCKHRHVVVHSCLAGTATGCVLGDFGGLPTYALGLGCRVLCAPVVEIPHYAASALHEKLMESTGSLEFGSRYLAAVRAEPAVSLYNLYGLANDPLGGPARRLN
jgi:hypothetical protein